MLSMIQQNMRLFCEPFPKMENHSEKFTCSKVHSRAKDSIHCFILNLLIKDKIEFGLGDVSLG